MTTYANRWTAALMWVVAMSIVWALFVPQTISVWTFTLLVATGLLASFAGAAMLKDSQPPRSVGMILSDLEAGDTSGPTRRP